MFCPMLIPFADGRYKKGPRGGASLPTCSLRALQGEELLDRWTRAVMGTRAEAAKVAGRCEAADRLRET